MRWYVLKAVSGRENGSGLGLTIAQSFVQQHGGTIEVTSRPGHTCFSLMLPLTSVRLAGLARSAISVTATPRASRQAILNAMPSL